MLMELALMSVLSASLMSQDILTSVCDVISRWHAGTAHCHGRGVVLRMPCSGVIWWVCVSVHLPSYTSLFQHIVWASAAGPALCPTAPVPHSQTPTQLLEGQWPLGQTGPKGSPRWIPEGQGLQQYDCVFSLCIYMFYNILYYNNNVCVCLLVNHLVTKNLSVVWNGSFCVFSVQCVIIGAGPCGLRTAVELSFMGARVVVLEKRDSFSRNNVLHLWPFTIHDLRSLGAKKLYGRFCAGSIDHISESETGAHFLWAFDALSSPPLCLQVSASYSSSCWRWPCFWGWRSMSTWSLKTWLNHLKINTDTVNFTEKSGFGTVFFDYGFQPTYLLTCDHPALCTEVGWRLEVHPKSHPVSELEFDVIIGADGRRNTLPGT